MRNDEEPGERTERRYLGGAYTYSAWDEGGPGTGTKTRYDKMFGL